MKVKLHYVVILLVEIKVMCFEYNGKIWKEARKSMFYNRDYCVVDDYGKNCLD